MITVWFCIPALERPWKLAVERFNPSNISPGGGGGNGKSDFHFTAGETHGRQKEVLIWRKIPRSSQRWRNMWASGQYFVHDFESVLKTLIMWHICSCYLCDSPIHANPSTLHPSSWAKFRVSYSPWKPPRLLQASAAPPSFLCTMAFGGI